MNEGMYPQQQDEEDEEGDSRKSSMNLTAENFYNLYNNWPSSRIVRVSRATGGKDRHSKVLTSKGLRDRRVRLSVSTAIQFYDLQDRLGYDQPSKAFEWLLKAASSSIDELPPIKSPFFPDAPAQNNQMVVMMSDEKSSSRSDKAADVDADAENSSVKVSSAGLSLSRSEIRVRARERAKGRVLRTETTTTKVEKRDCNGNGGNCEYMAQMNNNPNNVTSRTTSFTELLSSGMNNGDVVVEGTHGLIMGQNHRECNNAAGFGGHEDSMEMQNLPSTFAPPDLMVPVMIGNNNSHGNNLINLAISSSNSSYNSSSGANNKSSSLGMLAAAGINIRGTLQSNSFSMSESFLSAAQAQRFVNPQDGFFFSSSSSPMQPPVENNNSNHQHQFHLSGFDDDARLQLCYGINNNDQSQGQRKELRSISPSS